jgi:hypothetical protein
VSLSSREEIKEKKKKNLKQRNRETKEISENVWTLSSP